MTAYRTSMDRRGYNRGKSMLEVFIGGTFIQGFDLLNTTAEKAAAKFLNFDWEEGDLVQYRDQITDLLALGGREEILSHLDQYGLAYWPDEDPRAVFQKSLSEIERRLAEMHSPTSSV